MPELALEMTVNGRKIARKAAPWQRLMDFLRDDLHLTGTKEGCGAGECGTCSVFVDGVLVKSCLMPVAKAHQEMDGGIQAAAQALGNPAEVAPFFRIPGLIRANVVEQYMAEKGIMIWSADLVADDWKHLSASEVMKRALTRLEEHGKGVLLLHDIQPATALMMPKRRGPEGSDNALAWASEAGCPAAIVIPHGCGRAGGRGRGTRVA